MIDLLWGRASHLQVLFIGAMGVGNNRRCISETSFSAFEELIDFFYTLEGA